MTRVEPEKEVAPAGRTPMSYHVKPKPKARAGGAEVYLGASYAIRIAV